MSRLTEFKQRSHKTNVSKYFEKCFTNHMQTVAVNNSEKFEVTAQEI